MEALNMLDLYGIEPDSDFAEIIAEMDTDNNDVISMKEIRDAPEELVRDLTHEADTNGKWDVVDVVTDARGEYTDLDGVTKSTKIGGGGRFARKVDRLTMSEGYARDAAEAIAATVGRRYRPEAFR